MLLIEHWRYTVPLIHTSHYNESHPAHILNFHQNQQAYLLVNGDYMHDWCL